MSHDIRLNVPKGDASAANRGVVLMFRPFATSGTALVLLGFAAALLFGVSAWLADGAPPWPPRRAVDVFAYLFLAAVSIAAASSHGRSYALEGDEFVAYRFGRERDRHMLAGFRGVRTVLGSIRLEFRHGSVSLVAGPDAARSAFLTELRRRAAKLGGERELRVEQIDAQHLALPVDYLDIGDSCVRCGRRAEATVPLTAERGVNLGVFVRLESIAVRVPVCPAHEASFRRARVLSWFTFVPVWLLVALLIKLVPGSVWSGALVLALLPATVLYRVLYTHVILGLRDWRTLGLRTTSLSGDLSEITLRFARADFLADVKARAEEFLQPFVARLLRTLDAGNRGTFLVIEILQGAARTGEKVFAWDDARQHVGTVRSVDFVDERSDDGSLIVHLALQIDWQESWSIPLGSTLHGEPTGAPPTATGESADLYRR